MLAADEIIQQKEWQQLSSAELSAIADLAADEQEFNLLKKMLAVSAEDTADIPAVSPVIKENIKKELPVVKRNLSRRYWYAAAAAILAMAVMALFIFNKKETPGFVKIPAIQPAGEQPAITEKIPVQQDSNIVIVKKETNPVIRHRQATVPAPSFPSLKDSLPHINSMASLDASVAGNAPLLDLITEVE